MIGTLVLLIQIVVTLITAEMTKVINIVSPLVPLLEAQRLPLRSELTDYVPQLVQNVASTLSAVREMYATQIHHTISIVHQFLVFALLLISYAQMIQTVVKIMTAFLQIWATFIVIPQEPMIIFYQFLTSQQRQIHLIQMIILQLLLPRVQLSTRLQMGKNWKDPH